MFHLVEHEANGTQEEHEDTPNVTHESPLLEFPLIAIVDRLEEAVEHTSIDEVSIDGASLPMTEL